MNNTVTQIRREDAIAHGLLIDVTEKANETGIPCEVALTSACWNRCVQNEKGKLTKILEGLQSRFCSCGQILPELVSVNGEQDYFAVTLNEASGRNPTLFKLGVSWGLGFDGGLAATVFVSDAWWQTQNVHQD